MVKDQFITNKFCRDLELSFILVIRSKYSLRFSELMNSHVIYNNLCFEIEVKLSKETPDKVIVSNPAMERMFEDADILKVTNSIRDISTSLKLKFKSDTFNLEFLESLGITKGNGGFDYSTIVEVGKGPASLRSLQSGAILMSASSKEDISRLLEVVRNYLRRLNES